MKRIAIFIAFAAIIIAPVARAQDHAEVGAFVDYFKLGATGSNFAGVGGRVGVNVVPYVQIEAEMSYDFNQVFTERFANGGTVSVSNSHIAVLHGLFGPKIQTKGPFKVFATVKGGFTNFRFSANPSSFSSFTDSATNLRTNNVDAALYPGGGVEGFLGPFGLRAEVGDEIIFLNDGPHHNWKASFGPTFRF